VVVHVGRTPSLHTHFIVNLNIVYAVATNSQGFLEAASALCALQHALRRHGADGGGQMRRE
jgi:hypothetical protein